MHIFFKYGYVVGLSSFANLYIRIYHLRVLGTIFAVLKYFKIK